MKNKDWLIIAILTFLLAMVWVGVSALAQIRQSAIGADVEKVASPLNPNLDREFFSKLESRIQ